MSAAQEARERLLAGERISTREVAALFEVSKSTARTLLPGALRDLARMGVAVAKEKGESPREVIYFVPDGLAAGGAPKERKPRRAPLLPLPGLREAMSVRGIVLDEADGATLVLLGQGGTWSARIEGFVPAAKEEQE